MLFGLKATREEAYGQATRTATTVNKQCKKLVVQQDLNLQPSDYQSTALPLLLEKTSPPILNFGYLNQATCLYYHHHLLLDPILFLSAELAKFVRSSCLPWLAILLHHMHPLSPQHFSLFYSVVAFSTFVLVFLYYHALQISKLSTLHYHIFIFFPQIPPLTTFFSHPIQRFLYTQHVHRLLTVSSI